MKLRPYQAAALDDLMDWFRSHKTGNPIMVLPTGAGKTHIIAELVSLAREYGQSVLIVTPSKELCEQDYEKLSAVIDNVGIVSASVGRKDFDAHCVVATIGSIYKRALDLHYTPQLIIIDECHLVQNSKDGMYRELISSLENFNTRVIGLTATPFRGNGVWLTEGDESIWADIATETKMLDLIRDGYLSRLTSRKGAVTIDTEHVRKTGGDYNVRELAEASDKEEITRAIIADVLVKGADRKAWLFFCVTVDHAEHVRDELIANGVTAALITGETPKKERTQSIDQFKRGEIRAMVSVACLTTGFDAPNIDLIVWMRNTISPVLYVQGAGRGTRIAPGKENCLVLDYTTTVERLGAVDEVRGRKKGRAQDNIMPTKQCPECEALLSISTRICPECAYEFPPNDIALNNRASNAPILSTDAAEPIAVTHVTYSRHTKEGKPDSLRVDYFGGLNLVASEWVCLQHSGFAREKARAWMARRGIVDCNTVDEALEIQEHIKTPQAITLRKEGKYSRITGYLF